MKKASLGAAPPSKSHLASRCLMLLSVLIASSFQSTHIFARELTRLPPSRTPLLDLPPRPITAPSGTAFWSSAKELSASALQQAFVQQILSGNVPASERKLVPVSKMIGSGPFAGQWLRYWVMPDYLAIGSDEDFIRVPLSLPSVQKIQESLDVSLPTPRMVDDIYARAGLKLSPKPIRPRQGSDVADPQLIVWHQRLIQDQMRRQLGQSRAPAGVLVGGHKKDLVQTRRMAARPESLALYGWHKNKEQAIQPLSLVHGAHYADYSHGVRFVSNRVEIGNKTYDLREILSKKASAQLVSHEGVIKQGVYLKKQPPRPVAAQ